QGVDGRHADGCGLQAVDPGDLVEVEGLAALRAARPASDVRQVRLPEGFRAGHWALQSRVRAKLAVAPGYRHGHRSGGPDDPRRPGDADVPHPCQPPPPVRLLEAL